MVRPLRRSIELAPNERDEARWAAVVARDKSADGKFYYSVASTGVYCRPSCPSRQAKRENVRFHTSCAGAEAAGFRACKRCKSNEPPLDVLLSAKISKACRIIEQSGEAQSLADIAETAGLSPFHFHRLFKSATGLTPKAYADAHRHKKVREHISKSPTVTEAIYEAGFNSSGRFYANTHQVLGMTPTELRAGGANTEIKFALAECSLGSILVAATQRGVCAVLLGDDPEILLRDLQDRFPKAQLVGADARFEALAAKVIGYVEMPGKKFDLPLDVQGTAFQHKVWRALREIPSGTTVSYSGIANRIGEPKAIRAVAKACGANPVAIVIPCHRVVRTDGGLSGYRWGIERKRALLKREAGS